jgi:hypothetical protein
MRTEQEIKDKLNELKQSAEKIWQRLMTEPGVYDHDAFNEVCHREHKVSLLEWVLGLDEAEAIKEQAKA